MKEISIDLQDRRMRLAELILSIDEEAVIQAMEKLISSLGLQRQAPALTQAELLARLDEAMRDAQRGATTDTTALLEEIDRW